MPLNFDLNQPVLNDEGDFSFDLEDEREGLFDLNKSPANEESFNYGDVEFPYDNIPNDYDEHIADTDPGFCFFVFSKYHHWNGFFFCCFLWLCGSLMHIFYC